MHSVYLAHYGTGGMKWGQRRYQNKDGSLTPLGRVHYGVGAARTAAGNAAKKTGHALAAGAKKTGSAVRKAVAPTNEELQARLDQKQARLRQRDQRRYLRQALKSDKVIEDNNKDDRSEAKGQHKRFSDMSDSELNARINRLQKEIQLADLERTKNMGPTRRMIDSAIRSGLKAGVSDAVKSTAKNIGANALASAFGDMASDKGKKNKNDNNGDSDGGKKSKNDQNESSWAKRKRNADEKLAALKSEEDLYRYMHPKYDDDESSEKKKSGKK